MIARAVVGAVLAVLLIAPPIASQQQQRDRDLDRVRAEIGRMRQRLSQIQGRSRTAENELQAVQLQLEIDARELNLALETREALVEQQGRVEREIALLSSRIDQQRGDLGVRLAALYRMGPLTYMRLLSSMDSSVDPIEAASMLTYLVGRDARAVSTFQRSKDDLARERVKLEAKSKQVAQATAVVAARQRSLEESRRQKEVLLAQLQSEETQTSRKLANLEEKARRLENHFGLLYGRVDPNIRGRARVESFKGALLWPVRGRIVEYFGRQRNPKFATVTVSNGLKIETPAGTEVRSVFEGTVLFSQWFKGYGNLIILDHGNRIFSLYGNTMGPRVAVGDRVQTQQVIASAAANEENTTGFLYFEVREDNRPVDPRTWLR